MKNPTDESYLPYSRGLEEHLPRMARECRLAIYVYNLLLFRADYRGPNRGKVAISIRQIATFFGVDYHTAYDAVRWLKNNRYITYEPARNQHSATRFTITKYKTVEDFLPSSAFGRETKGSPKATQKRTKSNPSSDGDINELQDPNNYKNYKETYSVEIEEIIDHLNTLTNSAFKPTTQETVRLLSGRLTEGYTVEDCKAVSEHRWETWRDDSKMREYVRPSTLFKPSNFEGYLQEARRCDHEEEVEEIPIGGGRT